MREERVLLEEVADPPMLRRDVDPAMRVQQNEIVECDGALGGPKQARNDAQHGRLSRAGRPDERDRLAALDRQVGRRAKAAKRVTEAEPERHRVTSLTERRTTALRTMSSALIASATSKSMSNCS